MPLLHLEAHGNDYGEELLEAKGRRERGKQAWEGGRRTKVALCEESHRPCTPTPCSRWACGRNAAALAFEPELADLGKETAARLICHRALEFALSPKGVEMLHRGGNLRREEWGDGPVRRMRPNGRKAPQHTPAHCNAWHPVVVTWSIAQPARPDRPPASSSRGRPARRPGCLRGCPRPRARLARPSRRAR